MSRKYYSNTVKPLLQNYKSFTNKGWVKFKLLVFNFIKFMLKLLKICLSYSLKEGLVI